MHCIPCYNFLAKVAKVKRLPLRFRLMGQKTAEGIVKKAKAVLDSDYFKQLPEAATLKTKGVGEYTWSKSEEARLIDEVWEETFGKSAAQRS